MGAWTLGRRRVRVRGGRPADRWGVRRGKEGPGWKGRRWCTGWRLGALGGRLAIASARWEGVCEWRATLQRGRGVGTRSNRTSQSKARRCTEGRRRGAWRALGDRVRVLGSHVGAPGRCVGTVRGSAPPAGAGTRSSHLFWNKARRCTEWRRRGAWRALGSRVGAPRERTDVGHCTAAGAGRRDLKAGAPRRSVLGTQ